MQPPYSCNICANFETERPCIHLRETYGEWEFPPKPNPEKKTHTVSYGLGSQRFWVPERRTQGTPKYKSANGVMDTKDRCAVDTKDIHKALQFSTHEACATWIYNHGFSYLYRPTEHEVVSVTISKKKTRVERLEEEFYDYRIQLKQQTIRADNEKRRADNAEYIRTSWLKYYEDLVDILVVPGENRNLGWKELLQRVKALASTKTREMARQAVEAERNRANQAWKEYYIKLCNIIFPSGHYQGWQEVLNRVDKLQTFYQRYKAPGL